MSFLRSFAPWIAYAAVSSVLDWRAAAAVAFVVAAHAVLDARRSAGEVDDLTVATAVFFAGLAALSVLDPQSALHRFTPALSLATLGTASVLSLRRGRPFTLTFAKQSVPEEVWDRPEFLAANVTITTVWAASFLATAAVCAIVLAVSPQATAVWMTAEVIGFVVPMRYTAAYRSRARARLAAA